MIKKLKRHIFVYIQQFFNALENHMQFHQRAEAMRDYTLKSEERGVTDASVVDGCKVIVSLTTYGKRLYEVYLAIESLMQQTQKVNRIILWLAEEMKDVEIPITLQRQQQRGLEIRYTKDIRSYKKLIPTLKEYPEDVIITIDDDVIYQLDVIENLLNSYRNNPHSIIANWALNMPKESIRKFKPYREWKTIKEEGTSMDYLPIGCAGILYPPHSLDSEVMNEQVFMEICKYGDDIWFKAMAIKNGYPCTVTPQGVHEHVYFDNPLWQDKGLTQVNINKDMNDVQTEAVFMKYKLF